MRIGEEISVFFKALLTGNVLFFAYQFLRIVRRLIKHNHFFVSMEDLLFGIGSGIYVFISMYKATDGNVRGYFIVGILLGVFVPVFLNIKRQKNVDKLKKLR